MDERLCGADGVIVPGGFGQRGIEGKIDAIRYCRENDVPFLGVCLGMQCAVAEFARDVCDMAGANSTEFDPDTAYPVIDLLPEQKNVEDMGGTMRLGASQVLLVPGTRAQAAYGADEVWERHRHRYEVNNELRPRLEGRRSGRQRHHAGRPPGRDLRAARSPLVRRLPVPPRVQVAAHAPCAALPRLRRGRRSPAQRARGRAGGRVRASLDELTALFVELLRIPSPSGEEGAVADAVKRFAAGAGLQCAEDDSAARTGLGSGNLIVRVPGRGEGTPIALCAHLDTVPLPHAPEVIVENGVVRSDGETILGADDKAGVAALLLVARDLAVEPPAADVEIVITAGEEIGLQGAKALDLSLLRAGAAFVIDSEGAPGTIIASAPTLKAVDAVFSGVAAHAGIEPQAGRSAVVAAARAVAAMRLGRIDDETTANVGVVKGGSAVNVVPERCEVRAEARSRDLAKVTAQTRGDDRGAQPGRRGRGRGRADRRPRGLPRLRPRRRLGRHAHGGRRHGRRGARAAARRRRRRLGQQRLQRPRTAGGHPGRRLRARALAAGAHVARAPRDGCTSWRTRWCRAAGATAREA